jgi:hypothetical protein
MSLIALDGAQPFFKAGGGPHAPFFSKKTTVGALHRAQSKRWAEPSVSKNNGAPPRHHNPSARSASLQPYHAIPTM